MFRKLFIAVTILFFASLTGLQNATSVYATEDAEATSEISMPAENALLSVIQERGYIKMGVSPDYPPFEFITMENGENVPAGIDIKLGEKIAEDLGVELQVVEMEFSSLIPSLETGTIDMIISGMTITPERDKSVDFSAPYLVSNQAIVIRQSDVGTYIDEDSYTASDTIGVQQGTLQEELAKKYIPQANHLSMQQVPDLLNALKRDSEVDGVIMDAPVAGAHVAENEGLALIELQATASVDDGKAVVVPENQPDLLAAVNATVNTVIEEESVDAWEEESFALIAASQKSNWLSYWPYFWTGIKTTILISVVSIIAGSILGALLAVMRLTNNNLLKLIATAYVEFVRGTPLMIQVLFMFLGVGGILGISPLTAGLLAVSLNSAAYICEIIRGGIQAVDKGQSEAARSLGLNHLTTLRKVIFPQSLRSIWPSLGNEFVTLIKESSIVSTIGIAELTFQTRAVTSITYQGIIPLLISMIFYFIMTFTLTKLLNHYERKMNLKYQ